MKNPSQKQIESEIDKLNTLKPRVPRRNFFGEDLHERIDAQVKVLETEMDEDAIYDEWGDKDDPEFNSHIILAAVDAYRWAQGEQDDAPSAGWKSLAK